MKRIALAVSLLMMGSVLSIAQDNGAIITSAEQKFASLPNFPDCMKGAVLHGDPGSASGATLIGKATAGCRIPWHFHTPNEEVGIISGTVKIQMKDEPAKMLKAGGYAYMPSKHQHEFTCITACSLFASADGKFDIHYVDADGKEIPLEDALKKGKKPSASNMKTK
jgi:quercetin dioxygenase-like cupin family protein